MSHEAYAPTAIGNPATTQYGANGATTTETVAQSAPRVEYLCGDCNQKVSIQTTESAVRCNNCGCRILYKQRTTRMVQFEAR